MKGQRRENRGPVRMDLIGQRGSKISQMETAIPSSQKRDTMRNFVITSTYQTQEVKKYHISVGNPSQKASFG